MFFCRRGKERKIGKGQKEWSESYAVHRKTDIQKKRKTDIPQFQIQSHYMFMLYSQKST